MLLDEDKNNDRISQMRDNEAEDLAKILSQKYKIPYLDLSRITIDLDAIKLIPKERAMDAKIVVFQLSGKRIKIAIVSPNPEKTQLIIKEFQQNGYIIDLYLVSKNSLKRAFKRYDELSEYIEATQGIISISTEKLENFIEIASNIDSLKKIFFEANISGSNRKTSEILEMILAGAISANASDIHIEPQEEDIRLRFRMDGVLHDIFVFKPATYKLFLSRIKLISGLKLNIHDQAQDGRFEITLQENSIGIRVSVIPENYGESIVMRLLNPKSISGKLEDLGMRPDFLETLIKELKKPNGMILTTGPTGSGKTTTLYACLRKIYKPEIKIITLEDPIEYHLKGITQTQVEAERDYTFAEGLRSILRQDPDVILVGEIRDLETAQIAINAALTGHLVLSTLHTNDAAGTIPRLIDLGVNSNSITPAINFTMAQRLVRKLCDDCKEAYTPDEKEKDLLKRIIETFPKKYSTPDIEKVQLWKPKGCDNCNNVGYKKRIGIYEGILINESIEKLIMEKPSASEIFTKTRNQEILTMKQDGILKLIEGITSLEELQRVIEL